MVLERNDAERSFGFRLYQGGVPPGNMIRILNIPGVDVEACGGTHLNNTKEVEKIRIVKTERIQDGVNRIIFAACKMADKYQNAENELYSKIIDSLKSAYEIENNDNISDHLREISKIFSVPFNQLEKTILRFLKEIPDCKVMKVHDLTEAGSHLFKIWKKEMKKKKNISSDDIGKLIDNAELISGTEIKVITAISESDGTATACAIVKDGNFVAHIYDGKRITSAASDNVDIDFRECIASEIGLILGGSGGGRPKLTQSGGPNKDKVDEALKKAKELTIIALSKEK